MERRSILKAIALTPLSFMALRNSPKLHNGDTLTKPQVVQIPPLAGIGTNLPAQIPLDNQSTSTQVVTLVNLSSSLNVVLCNNTNFEPSTTWPLKYGAVSPQPGINNLWVQNPNNATVEILVLSGIVPYSQSQVIETSPSPNGAPIGSTPFQLRQYSNASPDTDINVVCQPNQSIYLKQIIASLNPNPPGFATSNMSINTVGGNVFMGIGQGVNNIPFEQPLNCAQSLAVVVYGSSTANTSLILIGYII